MKIKTIHFQNINSLRGEHVIDFTTDPLKTAGLFAITGKTGSGKSTLLDVISLALYNRIPRFDVKHISKGFIEKTGSILTRNTREAYAEVVYECHEGEFRSRWAISTARTGKLRDHEMELAEHTSGKILDLKKSEVPQHNETLIGLNYDQFIRSILLAQGDFARFLQSDKDKRGELLEKITGSWIYREIGKHAFQWSKYYGQELEKLQGRKQELQEQQIEKEQLKKIHEQFNSTENQIKEKEEKQKQIDQALKRKEELTHVLNKLEYAKEEEKKMKAKLAAFCNTNGTLLEKHRQLIPWEELLRSWIQQKKQLLEHQKKEKRHRDTLIRAKQEISETKEAIEQFLPTPIDTDNLIAELETFEQKVRQLEQERLDLRKDFQAEGNSAQHLAKEIQLEPDFKAIPQTKEKLSERHNSVEENIKQLQQNLSEQEIHSPNDSQQKLKEFVSIAENWKTVEEWLDHYNQEIKKQEAEIKNVQEQLKIIPEKIQAKEQEEKTHRIELENLRQKQQINTLTAKLENQRQQLEPGKPCPLCGSKQHPYVEEYKPVTDDLSRQIKDKEHIHSNILSALKELQSEKNRLEKTIEEKHQDKQHLVKERKEKEQAVQEAKKQIPASYHTYQPQALKKELDKKQENLSSLIDLMEQEQKIEELYPILDKMEHISQQGQAKSEELHAIYTGTNIHNDVNKLKKRFSDAEYNLKTAESDLARWEEEYNTVTDELEQTKEKLAPMLKELEYPTIDEAIRHLLPAQKYETLQKEKNTLESKITTAKTEKSTHEKHYQEVKEKDVEQTQQELEQQQQELANTLKEEKAKRDDLLTTLNYQQKIEKELQELDLKIQEQKKQNEKWVLLNQYIGDSEGKNFSTFAQQLTLEQLVSLANKRIASLSKRYLLDIPGEHESESLVIKDLDMGGERRSVKTLSGGESFLISLSLALALSDLASRNVQIKSLFIDEGFGSLDQVTLDQTLDTLEKLQAESEKIIGVISHIEALKERMDTQIEVNRDGQGFSSVEVKKNHGFI